MKYQVFLKSGNKMCSFTVEAKSEKEAQKIALGKAKSAYGLDFQVFKTLKG